MTVTAQQLVAHALGFVGTAEDPPNSNCQPFSHYLNRPCHFWCADFTVAVMQQMGVPIPAGADTASTRANKAAWIKAGRWVHPNEIRAGDVIFFHTSDRNGKDKSVPSHTGIATGPPKNGRQPSVDGNTSPDYNDGAGTENGGEVATKNRNVSVVIGAGRPAYALPPPPIPQPEPSQEDDDMIRIYDLTFDNDPTQYARIGNVIAPITGQQKAELLEVKPKAVIEETVYGPNAWAAILNLCTLKP